MLIALEELIEKYSLSITGVVHVGAHLGEEAAAYHKSGIDRVFWIEANPAIIPDLKRTADSYGHTCIQALISDVDYQSRQFFITNNVQSSSILLLDKHKEYYPQIFVTEEIALKTRSLDSLYIQYEMYGCNFLSLDLQGAELLALRGATELLKSIEYVYTEVNVASLYGDCARLSDIDEFLKGFTRVELLMTFAEWGDALYVRNNQS